MSTVLSITHPIATKDYDCDACVWLDNGGLPEAMNFTEAKQWIRAKHDGFKIKKGQKYIKVAQIYSGDFCTFRARPEIDAICRKYDIYEDD